MVGPWSRRKGLSDLSGTVEMGLREASEEAQCCPESNLLLSLLRRRNHESSRGFHRVDVESVTRRAAFQPSYTGRTPGGRVHLRAKCILLPEAALPWKSPAFSNLLPISACSRSGTSIRERHRGWLPPARIGRARDRACNMPLTEMEPGPFSPQADVLVTEPH